jgi:chaperonin GroES
MTTKNNIKPLNDYILIEPVERETTTASGIVIPDTGKEKPLEGTVVALGPGRLDEKGSRVKITLKKGDTVIYKKWGGNEIKVEGKELLLVKEEDILAVIEK